jgi:hypothetical protein
MQGCGGGPERKKPLGRPRLRERIILKFIFNTCDGEACTGFSWLRIGTDGGRL